MNIEFLKTHAAMLRQFAEETQQLSDMNPSDFLLRVAAKNQAQAANAAQLTLEEALATKASGAALEASGQ